MVRRGFAFLLAAGLLTAVVGAPVRGSIGLLRRILPVSGSGRSVSGDQVVALAFSPDGARLAVGRVANQLDVWEVRRGRRIWSGSLPPCEGAGPVAWSANGRIVAYGEVSGSEQCEIGLFDARNGRRVRLLDGHTYAASVLLFSPDGRRLWSGSCADYMDGHRLRCLELIAWEVRTGRRRRTVRLTCGEWEGAAAMTLRPYGLLQCVSTEGIVTRIDPRTGRVRGRVRGVACDSVLNSVAVSRDGQRVAIGSGDWRTRSGRVRLWETRTGRAGKVFSRPGHWVRAVAFSMDGSFLASGGGDGRIVLWDTRTGRRVQDFPGHDGIVRALAFSPDGRLLASGSGEREQPGAATRGTSDVRIWNVQAGRPKRISP